MGRINFLKIKKIMGENLDKKMREIAFEWFISKNYIYKMESFNEILADYMPEEIVTMIHHGEFHMKEDFFYFREKNKVVSLNRRQIEDSMEKELRDSDIEEAEKYILRKLKEGKIRV